MAINDSYHQVEVPEPEMPEIPAFKPKVVDTDVPSVESPEEDEIMRSASYELSVRANNFMAGNTPVHQHKHPLPPGRVQSQVLDPLFQSVRTEKSHRGEVKHPEQDRRLKQNKEKDDPSEHVETEREREARQYEEVNDKRREDEEIKRRKEEQARERLQEEQKAKLVRLQNTPFGQKPLSHFQPLSKGAALNEIIYHAAYGPEIRKTMGMKPTIQGLEKVRAMLKNMIVEAKTDFARNELIELNSKVANTLVNAGAFEA